LRVLTYAYEIVQACKDVSVDAIDTSPDLGDQNGLKTVEMAIRHKRRPDDRNGTRERFLSLYLFSLTFKNIFLVLLRWGGGDWGDHPHRPHGSVTACCSPL